MYEMYIPNFKIQKLTTPNSPNFNIPKLILPTTKL